MLTLGLLALLPRGEAVVDIETVFVVSAIAASSNAVKLLARAILRGGLERSSIPIAPLLVESVVVLSGPLDGSCTASDEGDCRGEDSGV